MEDILLVPPADWVNYPDVNFDTSCPACGCFVGNTKRELHRNWHLEMVRVLNVIQKGLLQVIDFNLTAAK